MQINIFSPDNNMAPSFGYRLPKKKFKDIREIPGLTCAKCKRKMLSLSERDEFVNKMLIGSKKSLESREFENMHNSLGFKFLRNLSKKHPRTPLVVIAEDVQIKKKIRNLGRVGQKDAEEIISMTKDMTVNAPKVMKKLNTIKSELSPEYQNLLEIMEVYSIKYPKKTFSEIFSSTNVWNYHNRIRLFNRERFNVLSTNAFKKLEDSAKNLTPDEQKKFAKLNEDALRISSYMGYPVSTKKIMLEELYKRFLHGIEDPKLAAKIKKQIDNLPLNNLSADNIIIGFHNKNDREILMEIVNEISSTYEHIVPDSKGGGRGHYNGICLCKRCNQERATIPYKIMMERFPDFAKNIQLQINKVMVFIKHGCLPSYTNYPQDVKKTLLDVTEQKLRINIKKYLKYKTKEAEQNLLKAKAEVTRNQQALEQTNAAISENNKRIDDLLKEIEYLKGKKEYLKNKRAERRKQVKAASDNLQCAKSNLAEMSSILEKDK